MLSVQERKVLEEIHQLFLSLERAVRKDEDFSLHTEALANLKEKILALKSFENDSLSRLHEVAKHLVPKMTLRHFVNFSIPFERLLNKSLQDDEFLIIENDKTQNYLPALPVVFVLDNIRSAFNVGSIFRSAECMGASGVYLCGYTPTPDQWKLGKTAMGTQEHISWHHRERLSDCLQELKDLGYQVVALETAACAQDLYEEFEHEPTAFVLGNERFGLDPEILKFIDEVRIIPLRGKKNSLNVGVTAAIAGFEWVRQWNLKAEQP